MNNLFALVSILCIALGEGSNQMRGTDITETHSAVFGTLIGDNTYGRKEGEFTVVTHVTLAPGVYGGHHDDDGGDYHDGRKLNHYWTDYKWVNPSCNRVIPVGDCHTSNGGSTNFSSMLLDVIDKWNNVPEYQNLTGATLTPKGISLKYTTCDGSGEYQRISSYNANYGATGWLGLASLYLLGSTIYKTTSEINEFYTMNDAQTQHVLCQEIGHGFPMGHQSITKDMNTCMDYSLYGILVSRYPNKHDVELIDSLYDGCTPTQVPTQVTQVPTAQVPTAVPTQVPTAVPTQVPTQVPTRVPTEIRTRYPTRVPTQIRTRYPTRVPTAVPTQVTEVPTAVPTATPTEIPTATI